MNLSKPAALLFTFALVVAACSGDDEPAPQPTTTQPPPTTVDPRAGWPDTVVFGFVLDRDIADIQEFLDHFAQALNSALDIRVVALAVADYESLAAAMEVSTADIGVFAPGDFARLTLIVPDMELLAQQVANGDATYHGQWFTNDPTICGADPIEGSFYYGADGTVEPRGPTETPPLQVGWTVDGTRNSDVAAGLACPSPVDLAVVVGKKIAFTIETSLHGFLVPSLELLDAGIDTSQYESIITGGHDKSVEAVFDGTADIGVSFDDARRTIQAEHPDVGSEVIVFNITRRIAYDVMSVRSDLPDTLKQALFNALADFISTVDGQETMSRIFDWSFLTRADQATKDSLLTLENLNAALSLYY